MTPYDRARQLLTQLSAAVGRLENRRAEIAAMPTYHYLYNEEGSVDSFVDAINDDLERWLRAEGDGRFEAEIGKAKP